MKNMYLKKLFYFSSNYKHFKYLSNDVYSDPQCVKIDFFSSKTWFSSKNSFSSKFRPTIGEYLEKYILNQHFLFIQTIFSPWNSFAPTALCANLFVHQKWVSPKLFTNNLFTKSFFEQKFFSSKGFWFFNKKMSFTNICILVIKLFFRKIKFSDIKWELYPVYLCKIQLYLVYLCKIWTLPFFPM